MAIVRITSFTKAARLAKKTVRYITHRRDRDGKPITRALFGHDGGTDKQEAYRVIDAAKRGTTFFRIIISPDPKREDTQKDLNLREITERTLLALQQKFPKQSVFYFAAIHNDHSDKRHVHLIALLSGKMTREHLRLLRETATAEAKGQRQELDQGEPLDQGSAPAGLRMPSVSARRSQSPRTDAAQQASRSGSQGGPSRTGPTCPNCGPFSEMERYGRRFECPYCGLSVYRSHGMGLEIDRGAGLSLSLGEGRI